MAIAGYLFIVIALFTPTLAKVHFLDKIGKDTFEWIKSDTSQGVMIPTVGKYYSEDMIDEAKGVQTSQDAKFYGYSTKFPSFTNKDKDLIIQFLVKHEQGIDCGGGYVKIMPESLDPAKFNGESKYYIMFGPDICGPTKKIHLIFGHEDKTTHEWKNFDRVKEIPLENTDKLSHVYTLTVKPDNTYSVKVDDKEVETGSLKTDFNLLPPAKIKDPEAKKPADWDDKKTIPDPEDTKPADWEKPEMIPDPDAKKPEEWDDEMDGDWTPPQIKNPEYKGEWKPKQIDNPNYKGPWVHPEIDNPEYKDDDNLYLYNDIGAIGLDLWQVKSGTIFDDFIITDDAEEADKLIKLWEKKKVGEKEMHDKLEEEERKKMQDEAAKTKDAGGEDKDMEEEDDDLEADDKEPDLPDEAHDEL